MENYRKELRVSAFTKSISEIKHLIIKDIEKIGGNHFVKNNHDRAYFPDWMNLEAADTLKLQSYNAYYDLKTGDFVCEVSGIDYDKGCYEKPEIYKNTYRDILKKELNAKSQNRS